ncbi:histone-lysine N-methyltransferase PRDM16 [Lutzomyia longipalpis]|nr:histone-lysine N-methyltransferase PRDM16 [Lutzomyia longipalpis]
MKHGGAAPCGAAWEIFIETTKVFTFLRKKYHKMTSKRPKLCILCSGPILGFLSEVLVNDTMWSVRDMLHSFSTKLDENIPPEEIVLCETCAMELTGAFEFLVKVQSVEEKHLTDDSVLIEFHDIAEEDKEEAQVEDEVNVIYEKIPSPEMREKSPPAKKRKELVKRVEEDTEFPSKVVIYPQFVVCRVESKQLAEDVASGRISESFLKRRHNLKTLDVTGVVFSMSNPGVLEQDVVEAEQDKDDMYLCRYCPKSFSTAHHLMMHTRKAHMCQFCLQGFTKLDDLHIHIENEHKRFECHFCPREFTCNNNLRTHIKKRHGVPLPAYVSLITVEKEAGTTEEDPPADTMQEVHVIE